MTQNSEKLAFYCELCDKFLESNICQLHGIDFVTIKKVPLKHRTNLQTRQTTGKTKNPGLLKSQASTSSSRGKRIVKSRRPHPQDYLPAVTRNQSGGDSVEQEPIANHGSSSHPHPHQGEGEDAYLDPTYSSEGNYQDAEIEIADEAAAHADVEGERAPTTPKSYTGVIVIAIMVSIIAGAVAAHFWISSQKAVTPTALYSLAENYFDQQNYTEAEKLYRQFIQKYPNDPLILLVEEKLSKIPRQATRLDLAEVDNETKIRIKELMLKANIAFQKEQYITPREENALAYVVEVLKLDPSYSPAVSMKVQINQYYDRQAELAIAKRDYNLAIGYYQRMLEIAPENTQLLSKIHTILREKGRSSE